MGAKRPIETRIEEGFKNYFSTLKLLQKFRAERKHRPEFILLVCARLDSLSNLAFKSESLRHNFVQFIKMYGKFPDVESISVPSFYRHIAYESYLLPGMLEKDGRLRSYDLKSDEKYLRFIWRSGVPINQNSVRKLLNFVLTTLKKHYRVSEHQSLKKPSLDSLKNIVELLEREANKKNKMLKNAIVDNQFLRSYIADFSLGNVLYKEYRCGIIHEYGFNEADRKFYSQQGIYWNTYVHGIIELKTLGVDFSAAFLEDLLSNCLTNYIKALKNRKLLPMELYLDICDFVKEMDYLDDDLISVGEDIGLSKL